MDEKRCTNCEQMRPYPDGFHKQLDGRTSHCKICRNAYNTQHRTAARVNYPGIDSDELVAATKTTTPIRNSVKIKKVAILTDLHFPEHDPLFWSCALAILSDTQPDEIILNGDIAELLASNSHKGAPQVQFADECAIVILRLKELKATCPSAKITYLEGNHETRLARDFTNNKPNFAGVLTIAAAFKLDELDIEYVDERAQPIERGKLLVLHGHQLGKGKTQMLPKNHTAKAVDLFGAPGRTIVYGHVHKEQMTAKEIYGGSTKAISLGCGRTLKPGWIGGEVNGWIHQMAIAYVRSDNGDAFVYPITVTDGVTVFDGKLYRGVK